MKDERTYRIIGCAMEVHRVLGNGFLEAVYQEALGREFLEQNIPHNPQPVVQIKYKGKPLDKKYQPDFICYDEVIARPPRLKPCDAGRVAGRSKLKPFLPYLGWKKLS